MAYRTTTQGVTDLLNTGMYVSAEDLVFGGGRAHNPTPTVQKRCAQCPTARRRHSVPPPLMPPPGMRSEPDTGRFPADTGCGDRVGINRVGGNGH